MAVALTGRRRRSPRDVGALVAGLVALVAFAAALYFVNRTDSRNTFVCSGCLRWPGWRRWRWGTRRGRTWPSSRRRSPSTRCS